MPDLMRASLDLGGNISSVNSDVFKGDIHQAQIDPSELNLNSSSSSSDADTDSWAELSGELDDGSIPSVSEYMRDHPDADYEEILKYMAGYSDEWAEKLLDYYMSQDSINKANEYNASREDTAYQRLVADLKAAGLNPAMMYGNSASPVGSASSSVYDPSGSASSSRISNLNKIKQLALSAILAQWQIEHQSTQSKLTGMGIVVKALGILFGLAK